MKLANDYKGEADSGQPASLRFYSLKPLCNKLIERRSVKISELSMDGAFSANQITKLFDDIDLELWAARFLEDMDRVINICRQYNLHSNPELTFPVESMLASKDTLLEKIPLALEETFTDPASPAQECPGMVREVLKRELSLSLSHGYAASIMVQSSDEGLVYAVAENRQFFMAADTDGIAPAPMPLRRYPPPPVCVSQSALPTWPEDNGAALARLALWNYSLTYSHQYDEQDDVLPAIFFNAREGTCGLNKGGYEEYMDLFDTLARYIAIADELWKLLDKLNDQAGSGMMDTDARNSLATFAQLAADIAGVWEIRRAEMSALATNAEPEACLRYRTRVNFRQSPFQGKELDSLTLKLEGPSRGPADIWPVVSCIRPDGEIQALVADTLENYRGSVDYQVPKNVAIAVDKLRFTLTWQNINALEWQSAQGSLCVERNRRQFGRKAKETNPAFFFKTSDLTFPNYIVPCLVWKNPVLIIGEPGRNCIKKALENAFKILSPETSAPENNSLSISVSISHLEEITRDAFAADPSMIVCTPVVYVPPSAWNSDMASAIETEIDRWKELSCIGEKAGKWKFSIAFYSSLSAALPPVLSLELLIAEALDGGVPPVINQAAGNP